MLPAARIAASHLGYGWPDAAGAPFAVLTAFFTTLFGGAFFATTFLAAGLTAYRTVRARPGELCEGALPLGVVRCGG